MSDLIDRQALLKQIDIDSDGEPGYYGDTWKFIDTIKSMPPATQLGTNLAEVGTDCISRQAAIDALRDWEMCYDWDEHCREEPKEPWVVSPSDVVNKLPPIQPKRGRWIGKYPVTSVCSECGFLIHDSKVKVFAFCPNCGCRMDGGEQ